MAPRRRITEVQKKKKSESEFFEAEKEVCLFTFSLYIVFSYHQYKTLSYLTPDEL